MSVYRFKPERFLSRLHSVTDKNPAADLFCAGFELGEWRCQPFAYHLIEWLPDYALAEDELQTHHGNAFVKLRQAALRVYTSQKYELRGEAGEIALHAICREFFNTVPISPRVFYKSTSNDVVKSFDLVHAQFPAGSKFQIWLGESKLYSASKPAISAAISSVKDHIRKGFLTNQKLILGPQIPKSTPHYAAIMEIFKTQTSIDKFLAASVFVIGILSDSSAVQASQIGDDQYVAQAVTELNALVAELVKSNLCTKLKLLLIYVPLRSKDELVTEFDKRLKALQ